MFACSKMREQNLRKSNTMDGLDSIATCIVVCCNSKRCKIGASVVDSKWKAITYQFASFGHVISDTDCSKFFPLWAND